MDEPVDHVGSGGAIGAMASIEVAEQGPGRVRTRAHPRIAREAFVRGIIFAHRQHFEPVGHGEAFQSVAQVPAQHPLG